MQKEYECLDVREAFDQGKLMLDGTALGFGSLLGSGVISWWKYEWRHTRIDILVNLLGRSSLLQGNLSKILRQRKWSTRLQYLGGTNIKHGRHLGSEEHSDGG